MPFSLFNTIGFGMPNSELTIIVNTIMPGTRPLEKSEYTLGMIAAIIK